MKFVTYAASALVVLALVVGFASTATLVVTQDAVKEELNTRYKNEISKLYHSTHPGADMH